MQTFGSLVTLHPHLHLLVTDDLFRPNRTFVHLWFHQIEVLTEAFRRALLRAFVRKDLLTEHDAQSIWPLPGWPDTG